MAWKTLQVIVNIHEFLLLSIFRSALRPESSASNFIKKTKSWQKMLNIEIWKTLRVSLNINEFKFLTIFRSTRWSMNSAHNFNASHPDQRIDSCLRIDLGLWLVGPIKFSSQSFPCFESNVKSLIKLNVPLLYRHILLHWLLAIVYLHSTYIAGFNRL